MKKKILSYVLAVALTMSSFAGASFAVNIAEEAAKVGSGVAAGGALTANKGVKFVPNKETQAETDKIVGLITQVFNYAFGILTTVVDANRQITVFDEGRVRATYGYNPGNGSYTLTGFSLFGGNKDLEKITNAGGIENFLKKMGASEAQLTVEKQKFNVNGDGSVSLTETPETTDDYQQEAVAWIGSLMETLKKGVNHSVSISLVAEGGATLTVIENGKAQYVLGPQKNADGDPQMLVKYIYNEGGFLVGISKLTYEVDEDNTATQVTKDAKTGKTYSEEEMVRLAAQNEGDITFKATYHITYMDVFGRESYTTNSAGDVLSRSSYSSNGALNFTNDLTNNTRTYYENGKQSFTVNEKGYTTQKYNYHQNGTLDNIVSYNYGVATQTTHFDFGKAIGTTSNANSDTYTSNEVRTAYYKMMRSGNQAEMDELYRQYNFTSVEFYAEFLGNQALLKFFGLDPEQKMQDIADELKKAKDLKKVAADTIAALNLTPEEEKAMNTLGSDKATDKEKEAAEKVLKDSARASNYYKAVQQEKDSQRIIDKYEKVDKKTGKTGADLAKEDIKAALYRMNHCNNGYSSVASVAGARTVSEEITDIVVGDLKDTGKTEWTVKDNGDKLSDKEREKEARYHGGDGRQQKVFERTVTAKYVEKETLAFTIIVKDRGQNAFSMEGAKHDKILSERNISSTEKELGPIFDPAVVATIDTFVVTGPDGETIEFTDENGAALEGDALKDAIKAYLTDNPDANVYVKANADSINMMDGGKFFDADGEEVYIKINADMLDLFSENEQVMFMW